MTTFVYYIAGREPYLTALTHKRGDALEICISNADSAMMRVGDITVKIEKGVGRVKLSALHDGVFTPEVIFNDKSVSLYPIRHTCGKISLACPEEICTVLGARVLAIQERVAEVEDEVNRLKDAVYGKAIF